MKKILIIQTAFIGDVILATALVESLASRHREAKIDFLLRKGNAGLLKGHPGINEIIVWDKSNRKYSNLKQVIRHIRQTRYDVLFNLQRFGATGWISLRAKANVKIGYKKNPFSFCFDHKVDHPLGNGIHEIQRNFELLKPVGEYELKHPRLYPSTADFKRIEEIKGLNRIIVMAPSSVWFTKQLPKDKWTELISLYEHSVKILLIGAASDSTYLDEISQQSGHGNVVNLAGELSLLESAALISVAEMTYVNDSAPLHLASAMNAPVTAYFCSTVPAFGFGPLSTHSTIVETSEPLRCKPCGLHGKKSCPEGHFKCGNSIEVTIIN